MPKTKKQEASNTTMESAKNGAVALGKQTERVTKAAGDILGKLMGHLDQKKIDDWQKKWLEVPEHRKKYEKVTDAPEVVGEELLSMTNDIIDFIQKKTSKQTAKGSEKKSPSVKKATKKTAKPANK